ncbi:magnesium transporter NIPA-domain-containing protein [Mycena sp. CBHHK59/15]|nr:magnesium transporter NIPA-domain-containing protein [Mycena sp. CBHHK59/15]
MSALVVGEVANFGAYMFAPPVMVTPLRALGIIIGAIFASFLLNEQLGHLGRVGCAMCILGSSIIAVEPGHNQFIYPSTYLFGVISVVCIVIQLNYANKALDLFSFNLINPIYYVGFCTATTIASLILFKGLNTTSVTDTLSLLTGFVVTFLGVHILYLAMLDPDISPLPRLTMGRSSSYPYRCPANLLALSPHFFKVSRFSAPLLPISQSQHASPTPSLLNVAAQPVAADVRVQPHYLGLSASRSVVPAPLDSTANARRRPSRFQSALPRLAPPRPDNYKKEIMATREIALANDMEGANDIAPLALPPSLPVTTAAFSGATAPVVAIAELVLLACGAAKLPKLGRKLPPGVVDGATYTVGLHFPATAFCAASNAVFIDLVAEVSAALVESSSL